MTWEPKIMRSYNDRGDPLSITIQYEQGGAIEQIWPKRNKPWVGLTEEDWSDFMKLDWGDVKSGGHGKMRLVWEFAQERLKEKNGG